MKKLIILIGVFTVVSCGGGGGDGSSATKGNYAGVWTFSGNKVKDDCNTGVASSVGVTFTVNQSGNNIVVNSNKITLSGVTDSNDGFTASAGGTADNGCPLGYAYNFKNASDGVADTRIAIVSSCGATCTLVYQGVSQRSNTRNLGSNFSFDELGNALSNGTGIESDPNSDPVDDAMNQAVDY